MDKNKVNPWIFCTFLALVGGFSIGGCTTAEQRQRTQQWELNYKVKVANYVNRTETSGRVASNISAKRLSIGMSRNDVYWALRLTGNEDNGTLATSRLSPGSSGNSRSIEVNRTVNEYGTYEQWVMPDYGYSGPKYIYIDKGILTSWQNR